MGAWGAREARGRVPADAWGQLMALDAPERAEGLTAATSRRQGSRQRALDGVESWSRDPSQDASDGVVSDKLHPTPTQPHIVAKSGECDSLTD